MVDVNVEVSLESMVEICSYSAPLTKDDIQNSIIKVEIFPQMALDEIQISFVMPGLKLTYSSALFL